MKVEGGRGEEKGRREEGSMVKRDIEGKEGEGIKIEEDRRNQ